MIDVREYIAKRRSEGCRIVQKSANTIDYLYIFEADGWISVIQEDVGCYKAKIQARDEAHADSYIAMIEPAPRFLEPLV